MLETWHQFRKIVIFSDYCSHSDEEIDLYYERHKISGRKDPAAGESKDKKPSHNVLDLIGFMKGL